ncbi:hypothetical protein Nepgr_022610 [Nepenthes gracilis]|uniref:Serine/threonine protein phosphatase 2A regulatory subunit n=1 Tax=Nepenthes gracilis TaxID=150966 RepID=A0AAD3T0M2_NEPGR|nr:hypothetical protein Nepgr_022610 [Nepenthes gracilis]
MIKQILGRLPKKQSRSADAPEASSLSHCANSRNNDIATHKSLNVKDSALPVLNSATHSSFGHGNLEADSYESLPSFRDAPSSDKQDLFIQKLNLCCIVFDFTDHTKHMKEKEIKRQTLLELVDYVTSAKEKFTESVIQETIKMASANLFRSPTAQPHECKVSQAYDFEEEEPLMDPSWSHLQIVYEFFIRFVASSKTDTMLTKRYINHSFLLKLLDLFDSEDPREREYLKAILHRIYRKFMVHRPFIRKAMDNIFYRLIFETDKFNGVAELLEVLGSIINGFALPLREEHKLFLVRVLIPLHKSNCLPMYHQQLSYCIIQFVEKDNKLADTVIRGLLKCWPITNSSKEVMFLSELEEVLEATQPAEFERCMVLLFRRIACCLKSLHFQVAERAHYLWNNNHIESLIRQNRKAILPIILPALEKNGCSHWNQVIQSLTLHVLKKFSDTDPELIQECSHRFHEDEAKGDEVKAERAAKWRHLEEIATKDSVPIKFT